MSSDFESQSLYDEESSLSIYEDDENFQSSENITTSEENHQLSRSGKTTTRKMKLKANEPDIRTYVGMASPSQMSWKINMDDYKEYIKREAKKPVFASSRVDLMKQPAFQRSVLQKMPDNNQTL